MPQDCPAGPIRVLLLENIHPDAEARLAKDGCQVETRAGTLGEDEEAQQDIGQFVSGKLRDYVSVGTTSLSVNLPGVALPRTPGTYRLVHLHRNVPGVLASINHLLAEHGSNIEGQLLGTRDEFGYVLTDIATEYSDDMLTSLRAMDVTIRLRTLPA